MINDIDRCSLQSALGDWMDAGEYLAHWRGVVIDRRPLDRESLQAAVMECATLRLSPAAGEVVVRPRWDTRRNIYVVRVMLTFRGMLTLMRRCPDIVDIEVNLVHRLDRYRLDGSSFHHEFDPFDPDRVINGPSDIRGGYARIVYKNGHVRYHYVPVSKICKARECATSSRDRDDGTDPWSCWFAEMALKTIIRDMFARSAVLVDVLTQAAMFKALRLDDEALGNTPVPVSRRLPTHQVEAVQTEHSAPAASEDSSSSCGSEQAETEGMPEWERAMRAAATVPELTAVMNTCLKMTLSRDERARVSSLFKRRLSELRKMKGSLDDHSERRDLPEDADAAQPGVKIT